MQRNKSGYTLLELLLAVTLSSVVFLTLFKGLNYTMQVQREVNDNASLEVVRFVQLLSQHLRSAYVVNEESTTTVFKGTPSSMEFISMEDFQATYRDKFSNGLKKRKYSLQPSPITQLSALFYQEEIFRRKKNSEAGDQENKRTQVLSQWIRNLKYTYYDGEQWLESWNSHTRLPQAVKVAITTRNRLNALKEETFSTIIFIPSS